MCDHVSSPSSALVALPSRLSPIAVACTAMGDIFYRGLILEPPEARLLMVGIPAIMIVVAALVLENLESISPGNFFFCKVQLATLSICSTRLSCRWFSRLRRSFL
jgi:hypothetical protein